MIFLPPALEISGKIWHILSGRTTRRNGQIAQAKRPITYKKTLSLRVFFFIYPQTDYAGIFTSATLDVFSKNTNGNIQSIINEDKKNASTKAAIFASRISL